MIFDEYTNYNSMWHRYYLTAEGLNALSGLNISDRIKNMSDDQWLMKVSDTLYDWLPVNKRYFEYLVATDKEAHDILLKALTYQADWSLNNGFIDEESTINWDNTTMMDKEVFERAVSPRAKNLLTTSGLLYCGRVQFVPDYSDWEITEDTTADMFE